jgi:hypothetical protein
MITPNILKFNVISFEKKWKIRSLSYFIVPLKTCGMMFSKPKHDICSDAIGLRHSIG